MHRFIVKFLGVASIAIVVLTLVGVPTTSYSAPSTQVASVRFAAIGDYGTGNQDAEDVANLVKSWNPDFIITLGDNNYPDGGAETIDNNIGKFYHEFIRPYTGEFGGGAQTNRFFPSLGNHDWETPNAQPYLDYFDLPGNERYYSFIWGPVQLFALDSDPNEPDGITSNSVQASWLRRELGASTARWKVVYMHHPPFSSGDEHGAVAELQWPFEEWGADAVIAAHDHIYERIIYEDFPYFVNGLGGGEIYDFVDEPMLGSTARYNDDYGAMLIEANENSIEFQFHSIEGGGTLVDSHTIFSNATVLRFVAEANARIEETRPDKKYGEDRTLHVDGGADPAIESYLRFTITGVTGEVQQAIVRVFAINDSVDGPEIYVTSNGWEERGTNGITWATRPPYDAEPLDRTDVVLRETWMEFDVTSVVQGNGTYSFVIASDSEDGLTLSSRLGDNPPEMVVTYSVPTPEETAE